MVVGEIAIQLNHITTETYSSRQNIRGVDIRRGLPKEHPHSCVNPFLSSKMIAWGNSMFHPPIHAMKKRSPSSIPLNLDHYSYVSSTNILQL
jgi:hypothetical protein